jgi:hypothetical protein
MAITILQQPLLFTPVNNEMLWSFSSDQTGQPNFSYKVELYIDTALFGTYEVYPMFDTYSKFDASDYVRSFLRTHTSTQVDFVCETADQWNTVGIRVYESYGNPPALEDFATSANLIGFNGALRYEKFVTFNHTQYYIDPLNPTYPGWLTYFPSTEKQFTNYSDPFHAGILAKRSLTTYELILKIYDITGAETYSFIGYVGLFERVVMLDISPSSMDANGWTTGYQWDDCYYYEVVIRATSTIDPLDVAETQPYRLYFDRSCIRFTHHKLYWMNKFGVLDQYSFDMLRIDSTQLQSFGYQVQRGGWNDGYYDLTLNDAEKKTAMKTAEDKIILNSDWMKPAVQNWLVRELYESAQVWLLERGGDFRPVVVENNQNVLKSRFKDGLIQETVNITVTWSYRTQLN